jgi:regulatory protein
MTGERGMHKITSIDDYNQKKKMIVLDDGDISFPLYCSEVARLGLKCEMELGDSEYDGLIEDVVYPRCRDRALHLLTRRDLSEGALLERLGKNGYPTDVAARVLDYVKEHGLVDDLRYAKNYVWSKADTKSRRQMTEYLRSHGMGESTIEEAMADYYGANDDAEVRLAAELLRKKLGDGPLTFEVKGRLMSYLARKGFGYDTINRAFVEVEG